MKIGDVYYEKHTVVGISKRTGTVSETDVEIVNVLPIDVLDKIRAEIEKKIKKRPGLNHTRAERERNDAFLEVLDIIDKYKAESEE